MTKKEMKKRFDGDIMLHLNSVIYYESKKEEPGFIASYVRELEKQEIAAVSALIWTANTLGVISLKDWETMNGMLINTKYNL